MPIQRQTLRQGDRKGSPKYGDYITIVRESWLHQNRDGNDKRGQSLNKPPGPMRTQFILAQGLMVKGVEQEILRMSQGEKVRLTMSSDLAYGPQGLPGSIPPDNFLIIDIELEKFEPISTQSKYKSRYA